MSNFSFPLLHLVYLFNTLSQKSKSANRRLKVFVSSVLLFLHSLSITLLKCQKQIQFTRSSRTFDHSSPPVLKLGRLCNAQKNFSSMIPEAWIINRGWSLNTSNTRILLVFNHPVDCLVQAVYFCSGQNSKLWTMGQECQSSKEIIMI